MKEKIKYSMGHIKAWEAWPIQVALFLIASSICLHLQASFRLSPVLSAAITGLLGSFIPHNRYIDKTHIEASFYTGAFVAMDVRFVQAGPSYVIFASFLGATLYFILCPFLKGFGGRLGTIAFITSLTAWFFGRWIL